MKKYFGLIITILIYGLVGVYLGLKLDLLFQDLPIVVGFIVFYIGFMITLMMNIMIHEAGHLVFGLLSGYKFQSYRVGSLMIIKKDGKLQFKKFKLAGTGGQCILTPGKDRKYFLYNIGGALLNIITVIPFVGIASLESLPGGVRFFFYMLAAGALATGLTNGIPLRISGMDNDGMNIISIKRNESCKNAFFQQMLVQDQINQGNRLKDIDDSLFEYDDQSLNHPLVSANAYSLAQKRLDEGNIEESKRIMQRLHQSDVTLLDIHKCLMYNDENYIAYLEGRNLYSDQLLTKYNKAMKDYPGVIRAKVVEALANHQDSKPYLDRLEKLKDSYPYPSDIEMEQELIQRLISQV